MQDEFIESMEESIQIELKELNNIIASQSNKILNADMHYQHT